jgi:hypothetical protein
MSELPAYVTVTDAAGRVLFRRAATPAEVEEAIQVAKAAETEAAGVLKRIAKKRELTPPEPPPPERVAAAPPHPDEIPDEEPPEDTPAFRDLDEFTEQLDAAENKE